MVNYEMRNAGPPDECVPFLNHSKHETLYLLIEMLISLFSKLFIN